MTRYSPLARVALGTTPDLPGGHVEFGESPRDALVRELAEELGVRISLPAAPPIARLHLLGELEPSFELAIWVVTDWSGHVTNCAPEEHDELRWFGADELPALSLAHPDYGTVLAKAISPILGRDGDAAKEVLGS